MVGWLLAAPVAVAGLLIVGAMVLMWRAMCEFYVAVFRIHGPFLFGPTEKLETVAHQLPKLPPIIVLRLRNMTAIDATGLQALEQFADRVQASGRSLILCGAPEQPARLMHQADFEEHVGCENICESIAKALQRAGELREQHVRQGTATVSLVDSGTSLP